MLRRKPGRNAWEEVSGARIPQTIGYLWICKKWNPVVVRSGIIIVVLRRVTLLICLMLISITPRAIAGEEACRIRVQNWVDGLVQVSADGGLSYSTVGRVTCAANARIIGFAASSYIPHGTVAATAVHGLRIKTGQYAQGIGKAQQPMMFSIAPLEFSQIPKGYGGHLPHSSGIYTDIYTGHSIFRNESPYVGNAVYVERNHLLQMLPEDYTPVEGETFVIIVTRPDKPISEIKFENKTKGEVTVIYPDGTSEAIASVDRPVMGVGRYDGTTFTGVGAINTNHGGVLTISTAPTCLPRTLEGGPMETRGGFMVQPYYHVMEQQEGKSQVMVIGPADRTKPHMEGTPPLFFGNINLSRYWGHPENSYRAQVQIDNGEWEDAPEIIGKVDDAFSPAYLESYFAAKEKPRKVTEGVTAIRLLFPKFDRSLLEKDLAQETSEYTRRMINAGAKPAKGTVVISPSLPPDGGRLVSFYIDGNMVGMSSNYPYRYSWDSTKAFNGFHFVEIETRSDSDGDPAVERRVVLVEN